MNKNILLARLKNTSLSEEARFILRDIIEELSNLTILEEDISNMGFINRITGNLSSELEALGFIKNPEGSGFFARTSTGWEEISTEAVVTTLINLFSKDSNNIMQESNTGHTVTEGRNTVVYAPDYQGIYRPWSANTLAWAFGRVVGADVYAVDSDDTTVLSPSPKVMVNPAATNLCAYSSDYSNAYWTKSANLSLTGGQNDIFGGTGAYLVVDNSTTEASYLRKGFSSSTGDPINMDGNKLSILMWIKKDVSYTGSEPVIQILAPFTPTVTIRVRINQVTGGYLVESGQGGLEVSSREENNGFYKYVLTFTKPSSGLNEVRINICPGGSTSVASNTGSMILSNIMVLDNCAHLVALGIPPIPTSGAAVDIGASSLSIPSTDYNNSSGWSAKMIPSINLQDLSTDFEIISLNSTADLLYYSGANNRIESSDGTNTAYYVTSWDSNVENTVSIAGSVTDSEQSILLNNVQGSIFTYDGVRASGANINICRGAPYVVYISDIKEVV